LPGKGNRRTGSLKYLYPRNSGPWAAWITQGPCSPGSGLVPDHHFSAAFCTGGGSVNDAKPRFQHLESSKYKASAMLARLLLDVGQYQVYSLLIGQRSPLVDVSQH
jgi:hypothetical protein